VPAMTMATIVLADDHPAFAGACTQVLCSEYDVVASVPTGGLALVAVEEHDPDLLVLDLEMPDMSGLDVLRALQECEARARIVVLTLHQDRSIADRALSLGASGFVTKSRVTRDLRPALAAALRGATFCSPLSG
jgi:DNA-binding NarL/FixJ family response regulator